MKLCLMRRVLLLVALLFAFCSQSARGQSKNSNDGPAASLDPKLLFRSISPSVFVVESLDENGSVVALGSAVAIGKDQVVTNTHVVDPGVSIRVRHGAKVWNAEIEHINLHSDLCRLRITGLGPPNLLLRPFKDLQVGEHVFAIGAPAGMELTISEGLISGLRELDGEKTIQTSAPISHGSSGGGLFDGQGRLVGITTYYIRSGQNLNFAIPTDFIQESPSVRSFLRERNSDWVDVPYTSRSTETQQKLAEARERVVARSDDWMAHLLFGNALRDTGHIHESVLEMIRSVELNSMAAEAHQGLGITLGDVGDWYGAVSELETASQLDPADFLSCFELAMAFDKDDRSQDAVAQSAICAHSRLFATLAPVLALSMLEAGDTGRAETVCQLAILAETQGPDGIECLARVFFESKRYEKAVMLFRKALDLAPGDASLHHYLALALDAVGEKGQALREYQRAVELNPGSPTFQADYERARGAHVNGLPRNEKEGERPN
jgi:Flp pilus assembly protein TadD